VKVLSLIIDGFDMPSPTVYRVSHMDLDSNDTYRNELGITQRDRIRQGVRKIELEWTLLNAEDTALTLSSVKKANFLVTFLDPELGEITRTMYVGDRSPIELRADKNGQQRWNVRYNLIEC
jgi:hypothetical protein